MKRSAALLLSLLLLCPALGLGEPQYRVAMITDYADITDQSFNQTCYEACKAFCDGAGIEFTYYKPSGDSTAERTVMVEKADDEGYNVIVLPGFAFAETILDVQDEYPDTIFIASDISESDLGGAHLASNVYCAVYREELCGYMAGYAAVSLGYTHLGFLGGMAVPGVVRYGYGFVQGADAAAKALNADAAVEYVYANQFYGDADITAYMDNWYQNLGVQAVFACGGGVYTSVAEAAAKVPGGKVIGVDVDQAAIIDGAYGKGMTLTSAMKGLAASINAILGDTLAGNFGQYGGKVEALGLVSEDPAFNYVGLAPSTQWADGFTEADYRTLTGQMLRGEIVVSDAIGAMPETTIPVHDYGSIK